MHTAKDLEEPAHQEFKIGVTKDQPNEETFQHPDWIQKLAKPPTLDRDWNKTLPDAHGLICSRLYTPQSRIIAVTNLHIVEWHNYKHLDWITDRKLTNLTAEERLDFNVSICLCLPRSVYPKACGSLQSRTRKKNKLMRINELHKFSDGTLNDVRTDLDDLLKGIRMKYLPRTIWRQSYRDKSGAMI
ncbi:hypothetical protein Tco_0127714 [Tanacetum coccineum]